MTYRVTIVMSLIFMMIGLCHPPPIVQFRAIETTPPADKFLHYRSILQPWAQADIEAAGPLPQYHLTVKLSDDQHRLDGVATVILPQPQPTLVFRLYPNLPHYNGSMQVTQATINQYPVFIETLANNTAIQLTVPQVNPTEPLMVQLDFTVSLGRKPNEPQSYTLFGWDGALLSLPGFYPTLAVQQDGAWIIDQPPLHGDVLFNEVALYQLDITVPASLTVISGGATLNLLDNPDGSRTWQVAGGPLRDMTVMAGPFQATSQQIEGTMVTAYYQAGHESAAQTVLAHGIKALTFYNQQYGPYPYLKLEIVEAPLYRRGMEYAGVVLIGEELYATNDPLIAYLVAHEVGHQWWYNLVGNNPYQTPWLDEGLTEYSAFHYYQQQIGEAEARQLLTGRWFLPFDYAAQGGIEGVVDRPATAFEPKPYELLVYVKAALFFKALKTELGEPMFQQVLHTYYRENRYRIATPKTFLDTVERASGYAVEPLAEQWLRQN